MLFFCVSVGLSNRQNFQPVLILNSIDLACISFIQLVQRYWRLCAIMSQIEHTYFLLLPYLPIYRHTDDDN